MGTDTYRKDIGAKAQELKNGATTSCGERGLGRGVQWWGGTAKLESDASDLDAGQYGTHAWALDAQAQGSVSSMPLGVYVSYASAEKTKAGDPENIFNSESNNKTAWALIGELGVIPNKLTASLAYRSGDKGTAAKSEDTAITLGVTHNTAQNMQLPLNHSLYGGDAYDPKPAGGDQLTTLMLFTAF